MKIFIFILLSSTALAMPRELTRSRKEVVSEVVVVEEKKEEVKQEAKVDRPKLEAQVKPPSIRPPEIITQPPPVFDYPAYPYYYDADGYPMYPNYDYQNYPSYYGAIDYAAGDYGANLDAAYPDTYQGYSLYNDYPYPVYEGYGQVYDYYNYPVNYY